MQYQVLVETLNFLSARETPTMAAMSLSLPVKRPIRLLRVD